MTKRTEVVAEVTGKVWKILKQVGDPVAADEEIALIESMKMEIPVTSACAGQIEALLVAEGDPITEGQMVAIVA